MVDWTIAALCCFTVYNSSDAHVMLKASEVIGVGLIAVPAAFVVPAVFNLRRQFQEERDIAEERREAELNRPKRTRLRAAGSRS